MNLTQPAVGVVATLLVSAVSLVFISLFDFPTFAGWVSFYLMCVVTVLIVMLALWHTEHPRFAASQPQPSRGVLTALVAAVGGAVVCVLFFLIVGGAISPPPPMLMDFTVTSVVVTFCVCIAWGGWPSNALVKGPVAAGVLQLLVGYVATYALFQTLPLPLTVSVLAALFLVLGFDVWPMTTSPGLMKQPLLGLVWTVVILAIGSAMFYAGTVLFAMDPVIYLVSVPVPFLFGSVVVLNMLGNTLFARMPQPAKGVLNVLAAIAFGGTLSLIFWGVMPAVSGELPSGPPTYAAQLWLANALLAVTFPFLVIHAAFFHFWPLQKREVAAGAVAESAL
jgi:hypothetical protein